MEFELIDDAKELAQMRKQQRLSSAREWQATSNMLWTAFALPKSCAPVLVKFLCLLVLVGCGWAVTLPPRSRRLDISHSVLALVRRNYTNKAVSDFKVPSICNLLPVGRSQRRIARPSGDGTIKAYICEVDGVDELITDFKQAAWPDLAST
jgi:hypothetical protein